MPKKAVFLISLCALLAAGLFCAPALATGQALEQGVPVTLSAPVVLLCEADTGTVIFEQNADEKRPVASVTKLMTLLITLEKLESGELKLSDSVTVSPTAASAIGSQALLDANAAYTVEQLLRSCVIASANDSAVALSERVAGTEEAFVKLMNARAAELGLENTAYVNCTGLPAQGQHTTARDIMTLSREVIAHETYFKYSTKWLDTLTHPSGRVTDLTNTNRLVRFYTDCDGLKTGSTTEALYCISATAARNGMRLIAVVLGAPTGQKRFDDARAMLDYGFANYTRRVVANTGDPTGKTVRVKGGARDEVEVSIGRGLSMLLKNADKGKLSLEVVLPESVKAPILAGDTVGMVNVLLDGAVVASLPAVAAQDARIPRMLEGYLKILDNWR